MRLFGEDQIAVLAAQPDRTSTFGVDQLHDLLVDRAGKDHFDDLDRCFVGDPKSAFELADDVQPFEHLSDLRPPAMNHYGIDATLAQQSDVSSERLTEIRIAHGMPAILHNNGLVVIALHVGQGLRDDVCAARSFRCGHKETLLFSLVGRSP